VQQGAGPYIRRNVAAVMATKEYAAAPKFGKQQMLESAVKSGREQAMGEYFSKVDPAEMSRRGREAYEKRAPEGFSPVNR